MATNLESNSKATESVNVLEGIATRQNGEVNHDLATLVDNIVYEDVYQLQKDGTQLDDIDILMDQELVLTLRFKITSSGIMVGSEVPQYPSISRDWYRGPIEQSHVHHQDWKELDVSHPHEIPRFIKMGVQLIDEETSQYKALVLEYCDIFAWSYKDLKGIPLDIVQHRIPLKPEAIPMRQKECCMNPKLQLIVKAELEKLLQADFMLSVEITTDFIRPVAKILPQLQQAIS